MAGESPALRDIAEAIRPIARLANTPTVNTALRLDRNLVLNNGIEMTIVWPKDFKMVADILALLDRAIAAEERK